MADRLLADDELYNSASDEEFDPATASAAASDDASSSDDEQPSTTAARARSTARKPARKRRRSPNNLDGAELDSGDEATIAAAQKRAKKRKGGAAAEDGDGDVAFLSDEGGEGGLVKTRAQRRLEQKERRPLARIDGATADVDAIWAKLSSAPIGRPPEEPSQPETSKSDDAGMAVEVPAAAPEDEETITIKRTYDFAGDRITEERQVPKASAEARLYLSQQQQQQPTKAVGEQTGEASTSTTTRPAEGSGAAEPVPKEAPEDAQQPDGNPILRRPLRRPSRFDPNPTAEVKGLLPEKQLTWARRRALLDPSAFGLFPFSSTAADAASPTDTGTLTDANGHAQARAKAKEKAQKLNTVDKSRLDWAGYVDKEGIADELDEYGRAKEGYLGRMDFLNRVDERREDERKGAKVKALPAL